MVTLTRKSYRARVDGASVVLEIDDAQQMNCVPQLMSKADVASRLHVSIRKVAEIAQSGRLPVVHMDGAVRFREEDVLRLLTENQEPKSRDCWRCRHASCRECRLYPTVEVVADDLFDVVPT